MAKKLNYKIGIDIGGTKMLAVLFDGERVVEDYTLATPKDSMEHFNVMLKALLEPLFDKAREDKAQVESIGVGVAGIVSQKTRKVLQAPNLGIIENTDFASRLEKNTATPVFIDNDANCFLRAEASLGAARKNKNAFLLSLGTGIGGAWWFDGGIYTGTNYASGEIGHSIIDFEDKTTLEEAYHSLTQRNPLNMSTEAYKGDPLAIKSFEEFGKILGVSLANMVNLLNPEIIVLAGGAMGASDLFVPALKKSIREQIHSNEARKTKINPAKFGEDGGAIGAAMLGDSLV